MKSLFEIPEVAVGQRTVSVAIHDVGVRFNTKAEARANLLATHGDVVQVEYAGNQPL